MILYCKPFQVDKKQERKAFFSREKSDFKKKNSCIFMFGFYPFTDIKLRLFCFYISTVLFNIILCYLVYLHFQHFFNKVKSVQYISPHTPIIHHPPHQIPQFPTHNSASSTLPSNSQQSSSQPLQFPIPSRKTASPQSTEYLSHDNLCLSL